MSQANEFVLVKVDKWYGIAAGHLGVCTCDEHCEEAFLSTKAFLGGGEWEQLGSHDGHLQRYRRKQPPSEAERVARELWRLGRTVRVEEAEFVREATELIAGVNAAELAEVRSKWSEETARAEAASWEHSKAKARVQELEAQVERLRQDAKVDAAFVEQGDSKCAMLEAALNAERLWIKQLEADAKATLNRTAELEAQLTSERSSWSAAAMRVLVKERNDARKRFEKLRDAVTQPAREGYGHTLMGFVRERPGPWQDAILPRLEAALAEPEVPHETKA